MSIKISKLHTVLLAIACSIFLAFHTIVAPDFDFTLQSIRPIVRELQEYEDFNCISEFNFTGVKERKGVKVRQPEI